MKARTKLRVFSLFMALCLMVTILPLTAQANSSEGDTGGIFPLPDPPTGGNIHAPYVTGYEDGTFRPDSPITRAEATVVLWRMLPIFQQQPYSTHAHYSDVPDGLWYSYAINRMAELHILDGYEDGTFRPDEPITREQFAVIVCKFFEFDERLSNNPFSDVEESWAYNYILTIVEHGLMIGYEDGAFHPKEALSRAEAITVINRVLNRQTRTENIPEERHKLYSDLLDTHWAFQDIIEASAMHAFADDDEYGYELWIAW